MERSACSQNAAMEPDPQGGWVRFEDFEEANRTAANCGRRAESADRARQSQPPASALSDGERERLSICVLWAQIKGNRYRPWFVAAWSDAEIEHWPEVYEAQRAEAEALARLRGEQEIDGFFTTWLTIPPPSDSQGDRERLEGVAPHRETDPASTLNALSVTDQSEEGGGVGSGLEQERNNAFVRRDRAVKAEAALEELAEGFEQLASAKAHEDTMQLRSGAFLDVAARIREKLAELRKETP